jgi:predicted AAA+ superfamily ATPase
MILRKDYVERVEQALGRAPVVALLGPRQCGKTTLARQIARHRATTVFDLESPQDRQRLQNPEMALAELKGLVVIDEIQVLPALFPILRVLADRQPNPARFLILGSAAPHLVKGVSESLAGRVEFVDMTGFSLQEIGGRSARDLWVRGGFPRSFLAAGDADSVAWREGFIRTFLERDLPQLGIAIPALTMRRFWTMLAHYHGQTWNASELARSMGLSDKTVRSYLDILAATYMIRQLQPWHENIGKRQVKAPKVYFRDTGLLHSLLALGDYHSLMGHPRLGASWEGFAIEQLLEAIRPSAAYYWGTYGGGELDLFFMRGGRRYGVEVKYSEAPVIGRSMRSAMDALRLDHLWVVHPGRHVYPADSRITVCPLGQASALILQGVAQAPGG